MLGLGLGLGVGNKAPLLPVSSFPTVADIPPDMVFINSDGTVWEKNNESELIIIAIDSGEDPVIVTDIEEIVIEGDLSILIEDA